MPRRASETVPDVAPPTENRLLATRILAAPDIVDRARGRSGGFDGHR